MEDTAISINGIWWVAAMTAIVAAVVIVVIRQVGAARRERARQGHADAYRRAPGSSAPGAAARAVSGPAAWNAT